MYITLESDYAVRIVDCLASEQRRMDAREIAGKTDVTLRFALKILRKLVSAKIVRSYKGATGGYELAKNPKDITLLEVIETVEGTYVFSRCLRDDSCLRAGRGHCKFGRAFSGITKDVRNRLGEVNFAEEGR